METRPSEPDRLFGEFRRTGDPRALGGVYDLLAPELLRIALHTTRDAAQAEDVLQATFLVAIEEASRFDPTRRVLPWLVGILAHEARKAKAWSARQPDPARLEALPAEAPDEEAEHAELLSQLDAAMERIPEAFRPVLQLRLRHGLSVTEIAAALGRPSGTVRSQLSRGIEGLRRTLPAGLARCLAAFAPMTRGIDGVRSAVLSHATTLHGSLSAGIPGILAVNKLVALAAVPIVLAIAAISVAVNLRSNNAGVRNAPGEIAQRPQSKLQASSPVAKSVGASEYEREPILDETETSLPPASPVVPATIGEDVRTAELSVRVSWPDGTPASGEVVLVTDPARGRPDEALEARTGAQGIATFLALAPGAAHVRLLRGGETDVLLLAGKTCSVDLAIRAGVTVVGRVVDASGDPIARAEVWLSERYRTNIGHVVALSSDTGHFEVRAVGLDQWIGARGRGFAPSELRQIRGGHGDRREIDLVLAHKGEIARGLVVDERDSPIAGAQVLIGEEQPRTVRAEDGSSTPSAPPQRARTDGAGRFELTSTPLGLQPVQVRAKGRSPYLGELEILEGVESEIVVTLVPAPRVVGHVHGPDGSPLASTWIFSGDTDRFASSSTWSRTDGSFELDELRLGAQTLIARHEEHGEARLEVRLGPGEAQEWKVELRPTPTIHGTVVDQHGSPLQGLVVVALRSEDHAWRSRSGQSDGRGRFAITALEPRSYTLWVQAREGGWRGFPLHEELGVWPGTAPLVLRVADPLERGRILAEIAGPDGEPVVGAELQVWHEAARMWRAFVSEGERGAVDIEGVPAGTVELEVRHGDHPWKRLGRHEIDPGGTLDLGRIGLEEPGRLRVRLVGVPDGVHESLTAMISDESNRESGVARLSRGSLASGPLARGRHLLVLGGEGVCQVRRAFEIEPGVETAFELSLEPCGVREISFALPEGAEKPKWIGCSLLDASGRLVFGGNADCEGENPRARVSAAPGIYRLVAGGSGGLRGEDELKMEPAGQEMPPLILDLRKEP
jgi:RNA polymerase sigma-70 factor (ECF subfamily)